MNFASKTEAGAKGFNQDALAVPPEGTDTEKLGYCLAVADGITVCPNGGEVAEHAVKIVDFYYKWAEKADSPENALDQALQELWDSFFDKIEKENLHDYLVSGATLTIALIKNEKLHIRHLGDSTCDIFLPDGAAIRMTDEHNTPDGCLINYFGGEMQTPPQIETSEFPKGSKVVLSSDGISYFIQPDFMKKLGDEFSWKSKELIDEMFALSSQAGSVDDKTVIIGQ